MHGDFSRDTFQAKNQFSRVLLQQGRVLLDADWNEQTAILLHYLQSLAADLIGPFAGPNDQARLGFKITPGTATYSGSTTSTLWIESGRYYVDGILCENLPLADGQSDRRQLDYFYQEDYPLPHDHGQNNLPSHGPYLVYLDVWERCLTSVEAPSIREVALGGPDTAARAKVVWQVKIESQIPDDTNPRDSGAVHRWVYGWRHRNRGLLRARATGPAAGDTDPCITPPDASYRGAENQLYRVEIQHRGSVNSQDSDDVPTFKWSRDNGSVVFPIRTKAGTSVTLESLGPDTRRGLSINDWVEVVDDQQVLHGHAGSLAQVTSIDPIGRTVHLTPTDHSRDYPENDSRHPLLRRWDQQAGDSNQGGLTLIGGAAKIVEGSDDQHGWLTLEDGIQIQFYSDSDLGQASYHPGDYWLIPARVATGDVEWPGAPGAPEPVRPHGIHHHHAPLAIINPIDNTLVNDLRRTITQLWSQV
jgi:hypothetical protein